jgi:hypothetical protein
MSEDIEGIERFVTGYSKAVSPDDEQFLEVEYKLGDVDLEFLREVFDISEDEEDPAVVDMMVPFEINAIHAECLQPYVKEGKIDTDKYDFYLECFPAEGSDWDEGDDEDDEFDEFDEE